MEQHSVSVTRRGAQRLRHGHPWVFRSDVATVAAGVAPGDLVLVRDSGSNPIGWAFFGGSELTLRLVSTQRERPDERLLLRQRIAAAIERRADLRATRDALRLVHGESDLLPGLLVDQLGEALVLQTLCAAMDRREALVVQILADLLGPRLIVARDDGRTRDYEALERRKGILYPAPAGAPRSPSASHQGPAAAAPGSYHEGRLSFAVDLLADQKTGAFLDQHENHLAVAPYAQGRSRALDLFSYHGGFGLQQAAAEPACQVTCVDMSAPAVERVRANAAANQLRNVVAEEANAFDYLRACEDQGRVFDLIVVDPPAFAKRSSALAGALRGYKDLNLRALRLLAPGGILVSCSCSAKVTASAFEEVLRSAAGDAHRRAQVLERRGAGRDHPALLGMPETEYLKCFVLRVLE